MLLGTLGEADEGGRVDLSNQMKKMESVKNV